MSWPTTTDYLEAVLHPSRHFNKAELKRSQVVLDGIGQPLVAKGKWRDVYALRGSGGMERWAIGCFTQEPHDLARRYQLINTHLAEHPLPGLVDTEYLDQGICIRGHWFPITRSRRVHGLPMNDWLRQRVEGPQEVQHLADAWLRLVRDLRHAGLAHGNLCADTVLVASGKVPGTLVLHLLDYDAIYLPALAESPPEEMGHVDYQHPQRLIRRWYDAEMDRFAQLLVYTALQALAVGSRTLWQKYDRGDNLLFREADAQQPVTSAVFQELWRSPRGMVRDLVGHLILASQHDVAKVPALEPLVDAVRGAVGNGSSARSSLTDAQVHEIEKLLDDHTVVAEKQSLDLFVGDEESAEDAGDPFALVVEDVPPPPPVRPAPVAVDPHSRTFCIEAWMPEAVAVLKLQGFVQETGGQVVQSEAGLIRVHLFAEQDLARLEAPRLLGWLGLVQQAPPAPRVRAVMNLELAHKMSGTRQLLAITVRLSPGSDQPVPPRWNAYCERLFCDLRAFLIGR